MDPKSKRIFCNNSLLNGKFRNLSVKIIFGLILKGDFILEKFTNGDKTAILTTHYMEEVYSF